VIETATAACSVALLDGDDVAARLHMVVGRGHAERLVPMIAGLPDGGRADAVLVDVGPGSFTGVRVGLAAARALGLAWDVPVSGCSSLALVAAAALAERRAAGLAGPVAAVLEGGHGEVFMQYFADDLVPLSAPASLKPGAALGALGDRPGFGSGAGRLLALAPDAPVRDALPDAADARLLPAALRSLAPTALYGRPPDAKPRMTGPRTTGPEIAAPGAVTIPA